jgi:2-polyprenyl-3-methyl-5-hydroxy-6-metoxy-1,4-benzoquinol methylase
MPVTADLGYALPNDWDQATRRFELLAACHDAASRRRAAALGVGRGWRCLDAGAGQGSFARWLAQRVGERGNVVAADIDVTLMADLDTPNVEVRQMDLTSDELPRDAFDLVHTRLALIHIAARDALLPRLAAAVRPGGVLLVEEDDCYPVTATATGAYRAAWDVFLQTMGAGGTAPEWARDVPQRLGALGLVDVDAESQVQMFRGGSHPAEFWRLTWLQARERAVAIGAPVEDLDRGRALLADPGRWFHGPATVAASGWRPGAE